MGPSSQNFIPEKIKTEVTEKLVLVRRSSPKFADVIKVHKLSSNIRAKDGGRAGVYWAQQSHPVNQERWAELGESKNSRKLPKKEVEKPLTSPVKVRKKLHVEILESFLDDFLRGAVLTGGYKLWVNRDSKSQYLSNM